MVMGVLNVTPDSFSDGGLFISPAAAVERARQMQEAGADVIDIGGESTRPGAEPVSPDEEMRRVLPVIEGIVASLTIPISLDTSKASVARAGVAAGAHLINDISAGTFDPEMLSSIAALGVPCCLMHLPVRPQEMGWSRAGGISPDADVVAVVSDFLRERVAAAQEQGIARDAILLDPGFGFGKSVEQNLSLIRQLSQIRTLVGTDLPWLLGTSRKSTIGRILGKERDAADPERTAGTAAMVALSIAAGADLVRVHDVDFMLQVVRIADAIVRTASASYGV